MAWLTNQILAQGISGVVRTTEQHISIAEYRTQQLVNCYTIAQQIRLHRLSLKFTLVVVVISPIFNVSANQI